MRIAYASDLHLEFCRDLATSLPDVFDADVMVLAGDTETDPYQIAWHLERVRQKISTPIILILGNHEYYHHVFPDASALYRHVLSEIPDVHFLDDEACIIGGIRFLGTTFWTDFAGGRHTAACEFGMADFHVIKDGATMAPVRASRIERAHADSWRFLTQALSTDAIPTVVVTHHAPSFFSSPPQFANSPITGGFCSNKNEDILALEHPPRVWIHGHIHDHADYMIGDTRVLCHPWGYDDEGNARDFGFVDVTEQDVRVLSESSRDE